MPTTNATIAEAFTSHRFHETYDNLAHDVRWVAVGAGVFEGRDAVVAVCTATQDQLAGTTVDVTRFLVIDGGESVAIDSITRYTDPDGVVSLVSSCDVYEFGDGLVRAITSYAAELGEPDESA